MISDIAKQAADVAGELTKARKQAERLLLLATVPRWFVWCAGDLVYTDGFAGAAVTAIDAELGGLGEAADFSFVSAESAKALWETFRDFNRGDTFAEIEQLDIATVATVVRSCRTGRTIPRLSKKVPAIPVPVRGLRPILFYRGVPGRPKFCTIGDDVVSSVIEGPRP